jgi:hypothetical protein
VQPYSTAFLPHVQENAASFFGNEFQGLLDLVAAVTPQAPKGVTRQALTVHSHQDGFLRIYVTHYQGHVFIGIGCAFVGNGGEFAVLGG